MPHTRAQVLNAISAERDRQEELVLCGRFPFTCASDKINNFEKAAILTEELGEVCAAVLHTSDLNSDRIGTDLIKELIHVAAVAAAWLESLPYSTAVTRYESDDD